MSAASVSVRIFSMPVGGKLPTPRRGAVKVWTSLAERQVAATLALTLAHLGGRQGLLEFSLTLDEAGKVAAGRVLTGQTEGLDTACLSALIGTADFPPPPPQLLGADCVVLLEYNLVRESAA